MATEDEVVESMPEEMKNKNKWYGDAKDYWKVRYDNKHG
jgi:hypothetical protein